MAAYFISDAHLGLGDREGEKAKENHLLDFLEHCLPSAEALFVLGDLFDFWFEYKTVIPKGFHRTLTALQKYTDAGIPVHYLAGNHDYWMDDFFRTELGMAVYFKPFETMVSGKRVFLHHGDGLAQNDLGYRLIKPVLRNRVSRAMYRWVHPDIGVPLARRSSRASRDYTSEKDYGEVDGMREFAAGKIRSGVDIVVMGHTHTPLLQPIGGGTFVNLGDWITHHTYGELSGGTMKLNTWKDNVA